MLTTSSSVIHACRYVQYCRAAPRVGCGQATIWHVQSWRKSVHACSVWTSKAPDKGTSKFPSIVIHLFMHIFVMNDRLNEWIRNQPNNARQSTDNSKLGKWLQERLKTKCCQDMPSIIAGVGLDGCLSEFVVNCFIAQWSGHCQTCQDMPTCTPTCSCTSRLATDTSLFCDQQHEFWQSLRREALVPDFTLSFVLD